MTLTPSEGPPDLAPGQLIGGRFRVEQVGSLSPATARVTVVDQKRGVPATLRLLRKDFQTTEVIQSIKDECRAAAQFQDPSILSTLGVGLWGPKQLFVASELESGVSLDDLAQGKTTMTIGDAIAMVHEIASSLDRAAAAGCHGAIRPSILFQRPDGTVRIAEFGYARGLLEAVGSSAFNSDEQSYLAPEVRAGMGATRASDVYGLAATLASLLTGLLPSSNEQESALAAYPAGFRMLLEQALSGEPDERFEAPSELAAALSRTINSHVEGAPTPATLPRPEDLQDQSDRPITSDFALDIDVASMRPPTGPVALHRAPPAPPVPAMPAPAPAPIAPPPGDDDAEDRRSSVTAVDLQGLLARIDENDAPRWMMVKDGLDHGPFSGRELVELIMRGELGEADGLMNMDTGARSDAREFEDFREFFSQHALKKQQEHQALALERSEKVEKVSNTAKFLGAAAVLGAVAVITVITMFTLQAREETAATDVDTRAELFERGEIPITGTAERLPSRGRRGRGGARPTGARAGGSPGAFSYEDAMNRAVELGDVSQGGGERQLSGAVVASTMNRHVNQFYSCVAQELRGGQQISRVQLDLAIAGSGEVLGVSARQGSARFQQCISARVRSVRFPSFSAPRMGARYSFSIN